MCTEIGFIMNLVSPSKYLNEKRTLIKEKEDCFVIILLHFCKDKVEPVKQMENFLKTLFFLSYLSVSNTIRYLNNDVNLL